MTYAEIEDQIRQLSTAEQILLAEKILHWLRESTLPAMDPRKLPLADSGETVRPAELRRGMLKPEGRR